MSITLSTVTVYTTEIIYNTLPAQYPLTATFTPPSTCLAPTFTISPAGYDRYFSYYSIVSRGSDPRCFPPGFIATTAVTQPPSATPAFTETEPSVTTSTFTTIVATASSSAIVIPSAASPARVTVTRTSSSTITQVTFSGVGCPASYTTADATTTLSGGQLFNFLTCCPPSMSPSIPPSSLRAFLAPAVSCVARDMSIVIERQSSSQTSAVSTVWAPAVLALAPTTTPTIEPTSQSNSLSTGAKAGIGVGVGVGVLLLAGLILAIFLRRKPKKNAAELENTEATGSAHIADQGYEKAELPDDGKSIAELSGQGKEKAGKVPGELPATETTALRAELEGDTVPETWGDTLLENHTKEEAGKDASSK